MRPTYETAEDRKREKAVADKITEKINVPLNRYPEYHPFDWYGDFNGIRHNVEIKCRDIIWGKYKTIILSRRKMVDGWHEFITQGRPFIFVVKDRQGKIMRYRMTRKNAARLKSRMGGRWDRGDPQDIEQVVDIPINMFSPIA